MPPPDFRVDGRVAVVTGASRGIGRAVALALAHAGADVVVAARKEADLAAVADEVRAAGRRALAVPAHLGRRPDIDRLFATALETFGRLDILVNNAAIRAVEDIDGIDLERWREVTGVILDGAWNCIRASLPLLKEAEGGAVINIGGMSAHAGAKGRPHVVAAKAGLVGLTRALAHDLAPFAITVNCVVPGLIETVRGASSGARPAHPGTDTLLGRRGTPEEVAGAVRFLAGPGARYITGQTLHVNGGAFLAP
jgi:3-oxoacyl-[acyl-carrier protein] reductase